jgi:hypothetical protein
MEFEIQEKINLLKSVKHLLHINFDEDELLKCIEHDSIKLYNLWTCEYLEQQNVDIFCNVFGFYTLLSTGIVGERIKNISQKIVCNFVEWYDKTHTYFSFIFSPDYELRFYAEKIIEYFDNIDEIKAKSEQKIQIYFVTMFDLNDEYVDCTDIPNLIVFDKQEYLKKNAKLIFL